MRITSEVIIREEWKRKTIKDLTNKRERFTKDHYQEETSRKTNQY